MLAATLASTGKVPVAGMALILGVDRFMSEACWDGEFDAARGASVLARPVAEKK